MPVYEYQCDECGGFTALRPMAQFQDPLPCPGCGQAAPRVLRSAPGLACIPAAARAAHAVNERSVHEPASSATRHATGCGCCASARRGQAGEATSYPDRQPSPGRRPSPELRAFPAKRPWMISH